MSVDGFVMVDLNNSSALTLHQFLGNGRMSFRCETDLKSPIQRA